MAAYTLNVAELS